MLIDASPQDRWWQDMVSEKTFDTHIFSQASASMAAGNFVIFVFWGVEASMLVVGINLVLLKLNLQTVLSLCTN